MRKKNFRLPKGLSGSISKSENDHFGMSDEIFFFVEKKVDYSVFWGGIHWWLPWCCNHFNIMSGSQSKFEKSEFFIVFHGPYIFPNFCRTGKRSNFIWKIFQSSNCEKKWTFYQENRFQRPTLFFKFWKKSGFTLTLKETFLRRIISQRKIFFDHSNIFSKIFNLTKNCYNNHK